MPDICMCTGKCPVNEYCLRYMGTPNTYTQTYSCLESECIPNDYGLYIPYNKSINEDEIKSNINYTLDDFLLEEIHKALDKTN